MIQEFKIPVQHFMRREDVKKIVQAINLRHQSNLITPSHLDLEGFIELFLQLAYLQFKMETCLASKFMPKFFGKLKEVSHSSKGPMFQKFFSGRNSSRSGDRQLLNSLAEKVENDPKFKLPEGYIKVHADKVVEIDGVDPSVYSKESQLISVGILDDLFTKQFGLRLIEPIVKVEK